jgi:general secretion pathway protein E
LLLNEAIKALVLTTSDANQINKAAKAEGMVNLRDDGINKVMEGRTTISEVLRVTQI